jgi:hypothetical protein
MKAQEIRKMVECKAVESVRVMHENGVTDWLIEFHMSWKMFSDVTLETSRGETRKFKTLDAVYKFLHEIGITSFEVISA